MKDKKSFIIRRLTWEDVDKINKIQKLRGFKEISIQDLDNNNWILYGALDSSGNLVGIVGIYIYSRLPHNDYPNGIIAEIGSLYVMTEARGNNLGCKLVNTILGDIRKNESSIDAIVCDTTKAGYAVFKKCGFIESTEHRQWIQL